MARQSPTILEEIVEVTSKCPWWLGVSFAGISFLFLNGVASMEFPAVTGPNDIAAALFNSMVHYCAVWGQCLLPALFLLGAALSQAIRFKRTRLYETTRRKGSASLAALSWYDFEHLIEEYFRRRKFAVERTKSGPDGGIDLIATKNGEKYLVQCKHWKAYKVGVKVVRELLGVMVGAGATGGFMMTSGEFTTDATTFARENGIALVDGRELLKNMTTFAEFENQSDPKPDGRLKKMIGAAVLLFILALCLRLFVFERLDLSSWPAFWGTSRSLLGEGRGPRGTNTSVMANLSSGRNEEKRFSESQIQKARQQVLREKSTQQRAAIERSETVKEERYEYEIELVSGGRIHAKNIEITDTTVSYKSEGGLMVSLNREEVQRIKKTRIPGENAAQK